MTAKDRKQVQVFGVLIVVLAVAAYFELRPNIASTAVSAPATAAPKQAAKALQAVKGGDGRIRLDLIKQAGEGDEVGHNNLFEYRMSQPPKTTASGPGGGPSKSASGVATTPVTAIVSQPPVIATNTGPPLPPPPPSMPPFKYDGYVKTPTGLAASMSDQANHYYNLREDDVVLGRYRIARVTDAVVEVEDLQIPRRQAFARAQAQ